MHEIIDTSAQLNGPGVPQDPLGGICPTQEPAQLLILEAQASCTHMHSITGDFGVILRLLPDYTGGQPQPGFMLDVCKVCMKELPERPYSPSWPLRRH